MSEYPRPSAEATAAPGLSRNAVWMLAGNVVFAACQWGVLVALARVGGPELVGRFTVALAIASPIIVFSQLAMRNIEAADAAFRYPFADYLAIRATTTSLALPVISGIAVLGGYPRETALAIIALAVAKGVESLSDVFYGLELRYQRLDLIAQSLILRGTVGLAALTAVLFVTRSLPAGLLAMAVSWAAIWLLFDRRVTATWREADPWNQSANVRSSRSRRRLQLVSIGASLALAATFGSLNTNVPRYFIGGSLGTSALGVFAAMAYFVIAGEMVVQSLCQAAAPELANCFAADNLTRFRQLLLKLAAIGLGLGVGGLLVAVLLGADLVVWLYGPGFSAHTDLFIWLMMVGLVAYTFSPVGYGLTASQIFRVQAVIQGVSLAVSIIFCAVLVPTIGTTGAAAAWLAASLCRGLIGLAILRRRLRSPLPSRLALSGDAALVRTE